MNFAGISHLRHNINKISTTIVAFSLFICLTGCGAMSGSVDFLGSKKETATGISVKAVTPNGTYGAGQTLQFEVSFPTAVAVSGTPTLELLTGGTSSEATYLSGSGSSKLIFRYTIQSGDDIPALDYVSTTSLKTLTGAINPLSDVKLDLELQPPGSEGSIAYTNTIAIDTIAPTAVSNLDDGTGLVGLNAMPTAMWDPATDVSSLTYQIAIGTSAGATNTLGWTTKTALTNATQTGLLLVAGATYYTSVRAVDAAGNIGSQTNGDGWIPIGPLSITPPALELVQNERWPLTASGGVAPLVFSLLSGPGTLTGQVFQAPNSAGSSVIQVQDSASASANATITTRAFERLSTLSRESGPEMQLKDSAYDASGNLYVVGQYLAPGSNWYVAKYDGSTWTLLEDTTLGATYGAFASGILVNAPNDIYVVGTAQTGAADKWTVRHYDGSTWTTVDQFDLGAGYSSYAQDVVRGTDGSIYVAGYARESLTVQRWIVRRLSGGIWTTSDSYRRDGTSLRSYAQAAAVAPDGSVYVCGEAVSGSATDPEWVVRKFDGTSWSDSEIYGIATVNESCGMLVVDSSNNVYAAGAGTASANEVRKWDGTSWTSLGSISAAGFTYLSPSDMELDSSGRPVLVYWGPDANGDRQSAVARYEPTPTLIHTLGLGVVTEITARSSGDLLVGTEVLSGVGGEFLRFQTTDGTTLSSLSEYRITKPTTYIVKDSAYDSAGNLYTVGFFDPQPGTDLETWLVRKFDGTTWTDLETFALRSSNDFSKANEIYIDGSNNVYVVGYAVGTDTRTHWIVRKFDGTTWTTLDDYVPPVSGSANANAIVSHGGSLYVAGWMVDSSSVEQLLIRKFDGTTWSNYQTHTVDAGANFSSGSTLVDMVIDSSNNVWAAMAFQAESFSKMYIKVYKFDGTTWATSDSKTTSTDVSALSLARAATGEIFQAYTDTDGGITSGSLKSYDGVSWTFQDQLGAGTSYTSMKVDTAGNIYLGGIGASGAFINKLNSYYFDLLYSPTLLPGYASQDITAFAFGSSGRMSFFGSMVVGANVRSDPVHYRLAP